MNRRLTIVIAALLVVGCKASGQPVDPFFGRTTVEPPRTGSVSGKPGDLYYAGPRPATPPALPGQPATAPPGYVNGQPGTRPTTMPAVSSGAVPPAYSNNSSPNYARGATPAIDSSGAYRAGERVPPPATVPRPVATPVSTPQHNAPSAQPNSTSPPANKTTPARSLGSFGSSATFTPADASPSVPVRTLQPRAKENGSFGPTYAPFPAYAAPTPASAPSGAVPSSDRAIEITELPLPKRADANPADRGARLAAATDDGGKAVPVVYQPSLSDSSPSSQATAPATAASAAEYAYDSDYKCLHGKLEYSQADRRWKLRYIPVDGCSDAYGGSVVIANPATLSGFERGEVVEVQGQLSRQEGSSAGFAPQYEIQQIRRQAS